ncbi:hypothetical protein [Bacillus sp. MYb209]|uniref:hypothetical protein n=1 Tax=Bacillus sp. MYb209 TaxID=1848605 RepID=UPI0015E4938D|nr:hypothetical protein [Bacillus sp. MYb209]
MECLVGETLGIILIRKAYDLIESISMCKGNEQNGHKHRIKGVDQPAPKYEIEKCICENFKNLEKIIA